MKRRSYKGASMILEWLGISGEIRTTQYNITFRQLRLIRAYIPTSRDKHMLPASVTISTPPSPLVSPLQMSFMDESLLTPLTAFPCPGYTRRRGQESATG